MNINQREKQYLKRFSARYRHLDFMRYTWTKGPTEPLIIGFHTERICDIIDDAIQKFEDGVSTFISIKVHHRSGKSDIVSRYLPAHFIGLFPDKTVLSVSHSASLATDFSRDGRYLFDSARYKELFPTLRLSKDRKAADDWEIEQRGDNTWRRTAGRVFAKGLRSGLAGQGYHLGILDDYCPDRESAESSTQRQRMWQAFTNDFLTRKAPVSITLLVATQWHPDDVHGRLDAINNPESDDYEEAFPVFEKAHMPARAKDYDGPGEYRGDHLFSGPHTYRGKTYQGRLSDKWYREQYSILGRHAAALLDGNPISESGDILNTEYINWINDESEFPDITYARIWDLAHSAKKSTGDDPDYTGGTLLGLQRIGYNSEIKEPIYALWIKHFYYIREKASIRDQHIIRIAKKDPADSLIAIENSLDNMDAVDTLKSKMRGFKTVHPINTGKKDKVRRSVPVQPIFDAGNVNVMRGAWNTEWLKQIAGFDGRGKTHDEAVDNITAGYQFLVKGRPQKIRTAI